MKIQENFLANVLQLPKVIETLNKVMDKSHLSAKKRLEVELVVEELFVNICEHAYPGAPGNAELTINFMEGIEVVIRDWGKPFNPLDHKSDTQAELSLEEQEVGGLGIKLVIQLVDQIEYAREDGANCVTVRIM